MRHASLDAFLAGHRASLARGPVGLLFVEDLVEVESTIVHALRAGFAPLVVFAPPVLRLPEALEAQIHRVDADVHARDAVRRAVNRMIAAVPPGTWMHYGYNAEYLMWPFCETRNVRELLTFHAEERRGAMLAFVIDLYAADLAAHPGGVDRDTAMFDRSGYFALARRDGAGHPRERQLDFHGGLRWRFEEFVPEARRRIDRVALFRARPGLEMREDHSFSDEEYNTYACPWHHNLTAAVLSFRVAKALKFNPGSTFAIDSFRWYNSVPCAWSSQQLLDLGLMEPGQWF